MKKLQTVILATPLLGVFFLIPAGVHAQAGSCFNSSGQSTCPANTWCIANGPQAGSCANNNPTVCPPGYTKNPNDKITGCTPTPGSSSGSSGGNSNAPSSTGINPTYLNAYATDIIGIINKLLVPILMAVAFITFLWGVYKYFIQGADSPEERSTGQQFVLWGVIGFAVIISVWGLVAIVLATLNIPVGVSPGGSYPQLPTL